MQCAAFALLPAMQGENVCFRERGPTFLASRIASAVLDAANGTADDAPRQAQPADVEWPLDDRAILGEMPGRGLTTWTFWQNRGQIEAACGASGARHVFGTADISTIASTSAVSARTTRWASEMLGIATQFVETTAAQAKGRGTNASASAAPQSVPVTTPDAFRAMPGNELVAVLAGGADGTVRVPMRRRKVRYLAERPFRALYDDIAPPDAT